MYRIIFVFFFLSGFSSLVFEILWERMLREVFGTTSFALSTLLTAFMGGMALGSWLCSKYADDLDHPLVVYGLLEGAIGLYALFVPIALDFLPTAYDWIFDFYLANFYLFSLLRFAAAFAILILPTTLMGATLPIVSRWVSQRKHLFQGSIGLLYGVNTFGACIGTLMAGFALLPALGLSTTNTTFAIVNLALCGLVLLTALLGRDALAPADAFDSVLEASTDDMSTSEVSAIGGRIDPDPLPEWMIAVVFAAFAISGALSMSYQVLWTRAYVIVLGSSTYSFSLILAAFLIGIAAGSSILSSFVDRIRRPVFWLSLTQFGVAAFATVAFFVLDNLPSWLFHRFRQQVDSPAEVYIYYFFLVGIIVLIPTLFQGMSFPLVIRAIVGDRDESGREVGRAYSFNTAGSIVGSFAAGFILLVLLGLNTSMRVVIGLNIAVALALGILELRDYWTRKRVAGVVGAGLLAVGGFVLAPGIDRADFTRGMFRVSWAREMYTESEFRRDDPEILFYEDGLTATVSVEDRPSVRTLKANAKPEASDTGDMSTQILVGILPYVVRSSFEGVSLGGEKSAMVGFGSGVTAGAALQWPLESLEVIEIEQAMVRASKYFNHVNNKPLQDERLEMIEADGRNYLEYTDQTYDVIVSEPSNPWIAGVASLFTVDHFRNIKRRLREDGVFAQWVQLYEMRPLNVRTILNSLRVVFPHVHAFTTKAEGTDVVLVASKRPISFPADGWSRAWSVSSARKELKRADIDDIYDLYGLAFLAQHEIDGFARGAPLNTDDNMRLEFQAPKDLINYKSGARYFTNEFFEREVYGDLRPYLEAWPDRDTWTPERAGRLARSTWIGGKPTFAHTLLDDLGYGSVADLPESLSRPYDALESVHVVRRTRDLDIDRVVVRDWPDRESEFHRILENAVRNESHPQAIRWVQATADSDGEIFEGERGLLNLYLLYHEEYFFTAELQIELLQQEEDSGIRDSLPFQLLRGAVRVERGDFRKAWNAYLDAAEILAGEPTE